MTANASAAELSITAPTACAVADEQTFRTERALSQSIESAAPVRCSVHIERTARRYAARLEVEPIGSAGPSRSRSFLAPTRAKLTDTLAPAVVLGIGDGSGDLSADDLHAPLADDPAEAASDASRAARTVTESSAVGAAAEADTTTARGAGSAAGGPSVAAGAALVGDAASLPGSGLGVALGVAVGGEVLELRLLGTYLPAREASRQTPSGSGGVTVGLLAGAVAGCLPRLLRVSELELGVCAGAELGSLSATGTGVDISRSASVLWSALRADASARWALGRGLTLDLLLSALVPTERHEFTISEVGPVFRPSALVGRAGVGVSYAFGGAAPHAR